MNLERAARYNDDLAKEITTLKSKYDITDEIRPTKTLGQKVRTVVCWVVALGLFATVILLIVHSENNSHDNEVDKFSAVCDKLNGETVESDHGKYECIKDEKIVYSANF